MLENRKILKLFWLFSNVIVRGARGPKFKMLMLISLCLGLVNMREITQYISEAPWHAGRVKEAFQEDLNHSSIYFCPRRSQLVECIFSVSGSEWWGCWAVAVLMVFTLSHVVWSEHNTHHTGPPVSSQWWQGGRREEEVSPHNNKSQKFYLSHSKCPQHQIGLLTNGLM